MRLNAIGYYWREAFISLMRNSWLSIASVGTVTISLLIFGCSLLLVLNANNLTRNMESSVEISAYLDEKATKADVAKLRDNINFLPNVEQVEYISKEQALEDMKKDFGENKGILEGLEKDNPLPETLRIKTRHADQVAGVAAQVKELAGVDDVRYGQSVVETLVNITQYVRVAGLATVAVLGMAAIFLISTTTRMSVFSRRREIGIMKMLGASNWFVRFPFLLEGMLLGLTGSLIAAGLVQLGYISLVNRLIITLPFITLITDRQLILSLLGGLVGLGLLIGSIGSGISMRKFLKV